MDNVNIVLCGLGGQGILFITKVLAQAALAKGYDVMAAETHGMAQRGGSVVSHLRLGTVQSSLVRVGSAHILLALDENEGYRNLSFLAPGAGMYVNTAAEKFPRPETKPFFEKKGIDCQGVPASRIAMDLGAPLSSNLALLGFFAAFDQGPITKDEMRATIESISPERFKPQNLKVFDEAHGWGIKRNAA